MTFEILIGLKPISQDWRTLANSTQRKMQKTNQAFRNGIHLPRRDDQMFFDSAWIISQRYNDSQIGLHRKGKLTFLHVNRRNSSLRWLWSQMMAICPQKSRLPLQAFLFAGTRNVPFLDTHSIIPFLAFGA